MNDQKVSALLKMRQKATSYKEINNFGGAGTHRKALIAPLLYKIASICFFQHKNLKKTVK